MNEFQNIVKEVRKDIITMTYNVGSLGAHIGGSLSLAEIMAVLYLKANINKNNLQDESRDRIILSKGHGVIAQYAAMKQIGIINKEDILTFKKNNSILTAHPSLNSSIGIEFSSGSLGMGLSLGVGVCLALKRKNNKKSKVYVILGDGECNEGSIWEACASASHYNLKNLVAIIDKNNLQYDGATEDVLSMASLEEKFKSFGWDTISIDGHNCNEIYNAIKLEIKKPLAIIANTIKGNGVSFIANDYTWHNHRLTKEQYAQAIKEQELI